MPFALFLRQEVVPHEAAWTEAGIVDRAIWQKAGGNGFLCMDVPEAYGGLGVGDFRFNVIVSEELAYAHISSLGFSVHSDIAVPYLIRLGTDEQKRRWLPRLAAGEMVCSIAMTEPNTGSDLRGVQTTAVSQPDGSYLLNGQKTFITNGHSLLVSASSSPRPTPNGATKVSACSLSKTAWTALNIVEGLHKNGDAGERHRRDVL